MIAHQGSKARKGLKATVAAVAAVATLGGFAGLAASANAAQGKTVEQLSEHGAAQRIAAIGSKTAKNVILFIGDGMGDSEITVARDYLKGANGSFDGLDRIGQPGALGDTEAGTGQYTTFSLGASSDDSLMAKGKDGKLAGSKTAGKVTAVTDSSASGSAWATGTKTYNNAVDVDVKGNPQLNLMELARAKGLATGNVTTSEIQDATPAVQESHSTERACYGPQGKTDGTGDSNAVKNCLADQLKENGGIGSISEQMLDTRNDVTIGGGAKYLNQTVQGGEYKGRTVWQQAEAMGYQTVNKDIAAFKNLTYQEGKPVLALLGDGNLPTKFAPSAATPQDPAKDATPVSCAVNKDWLGNQGASLADMTAKAIDLLKANPKSAKGFLLQVEGASIDKQDHNANACGQIGETDDLDQAISTALKKVDLSDTLVIVTADHAHTSQILNAQPAYALSTVLKSPADGAKIVVGYGTATAAGSDDKKGYDGGDMEHTGTQLRIAASGPGAQRVTGLTDQTDNFYTIGKALGLAVDSAQQKALSDGAKVEIATESGKTVAKASGFDGDAVLSVAVNGRTVSSQTTPVSGVRVCTGQTTPITLDGVQKGDRVTITGRQSGKSVETTVGQSAPQPEPEPEPEPGARVDIIRLNNPGAANDHIVTTDATEISVLKQGGWDEEGVAFRTVPQGTKGAVAVRRLYQPAVRDHVYTTDIQEIATLTANGWNDEGVAFYAPADGTVSVKRLYDAGSMRHLFTADQAESAALIAQGWTLEGEAFKAF